MSEVTTPAAAPQPVLSLLEALEDGTFLADANRELTQLVAALAEHQQNTRRDAKASLAIVIEFVDDGKIVEVSSRVTSKLPKPVRGRSILFRGRGNVLVRSNPEQIDAFKDGAGPRPFAVAK